MTLKTIIHTQTVRLKTLSVSTLCVVAATMVSCDSAIYDYEGDCEPRYRVNFLYDYNMKFADAFPHEVGSVTLRLIDADGNVVWHGTESGEALLRPGYFMDVDCDPGTYSLHVWAEGHEGKSFVLADANADRLGVLTAQMPLETMLDRDYQFSSSFRLRDLYHGYKTNVTFPDAEGTHISTVPLTKDTNYLRVVLQQTSRNGKLNTDDLSISVTDDNGFLNYDNSPAQGGLTTYSPWSVTALEADIEDKGLCYGVLAEFSLSRLMAEHRETARLTVRSKDKTIFSIKLINFLLMVKGNYNRQLEDQEYLDRQDVWELSFFLEEGKEWLGTEVFINSWRVVLQDEDL